MTIITNELDPESIIHKIEQLKHDLNEPHSDQIKTNQNAGLFIRENADALILLLKDLRRRQVNDSHGMHSTILIEGYSEESISSALSDALDKASHYFSEQHDVSINLIDLTKIPHGGYRALLEIHVTSLTHKHRLKYQGQDVELKHIHDHDYKLRKKYEQEHIKHIIFDHFAATTGGNYPEIPDYFLININDSKLMNFMIEKSFLKAGGNKPDAQPEEEKPVQVLIRVIRHDKMPPPGTGTVIIVS